MKPGDRAVAGTPVALETAQPGYTRLDFEETAPLPAGLVAFAVGPFELIDAGVGGAASVPIDLVVPRGRGREARLAAEVMPRILEALEAEVGRPYPYRKCDVVAVPRHGWSLGHPGLTALDQAVALVAPTEETRERREALAGLAAHELAHHWYGGLVTPAWWDEAWLGESFAAWEGAGVTERLEPGWPALVTARSAWRAAGLAADARPSARRVRQPIRSRLDLEAALDQGLTHDKGAALLTMYEAFLGRERFRAVVRAHLDARAHGVAASDDFLLALSAAAGPQVAVSLRSFLDQPGAPLLKATSSCGRGGARVTITQERFLETGARDRTGRWTAPVCLRAGAAARETTVCGLVGGPRAELPLPFCPEWIWPNAGGTGYYLTALAPAELPRQLPHLTPAEKLALVTDLTLLSRRGDLGIADALGLVALLAREPDRLLVAGSITLAGLIDPSRLAGAELAPWRGWVRRTWGERARALGWLPRPDDDDEARALRRQLVPLVAGPGEEAVLAGEALALARRWLADRRQVPAEVAWPALAVAARVAIRRSSTGPWPSWPGPPIRPSGPGWWARSGASRIRRWPGAPWRRSPDRAPSRARSRRCSSGSWPAGPPGPSPGASSSTAGPRWRRGWGPSRRPLSSPPRPGSPVTRDGGKRWSASSGRAWRRSTGRRGRSGRRWKRPTRAPLQDRETRRRSPASWPELRRLDAPGRHGHYLSPCPPTCRRSRRSIGSGPETPASPPTSCRSTRWLASSTGRR